MTRPRTSTTAASALALGTAVAGTLLLGSALTLVAGVVHFSEVRDRPGSAVRLGASAVVTEALIAPPDPSPSAAQLGGPSLTSGGYPYPIYSSAEAITRALQIAPQGFTPAEIAARLLDYQTLEAWIGREGSRSSPAAPVWLVGMKGGSVSVSDFVLGAGLMSEEFLDMTQPDGTPVAQGPDDVYFDGFYYIFDANGGHGKGGGVLQNGSPQSFASLSALASMSLEVTEATPIPRPLGGTGPMPEPPP